MIVFEMIIIIILCAFVFYGLFFGFIRSIGSFLAYLIGAWAANHYYEYLNFNFISNGIGDIVSFLLIFILVSKAINLLFLFVDKIFGIISFVPFLKIINRLAGALLGFVAGSLIIGIFFYTIIQNSITRFIFGKLIFGSKIAMFFVKFAILAKPVLALN